MVGDFTGGIGASDENAIEKENWSGGIVVFGTMGECGKWSEDGGGELFSFSPPYLGNISRVYSILIRKA